MLLKAYCNNTSPRSFCPKKVLTKVFEFPMERLFSFWLRKMIVKVNLLKFRKAGFRSTIFKKVGDDGFLSVGDIKPIYNVFRYVSNMFFVSQDFLNYRYLIIHFIKFPLNQG